MIYTAEEYAGIGAWLVGFQKAWDKRNDKHKTLYYAEWSKYASCDYSSVHNISEDYNIWDTSLGYREFKLNGVEMYGIHTCMHGVEYIYYKELKVEDYRETKDGEEIIYYKTEIEYDNDLIFDDINKCYKKLIEIRSSHKLFKVDKKGQFILNNQELDYLFYSPPCQSFSIAGKREGTTVDKGNMFYNSLIRIKKLQPKVAIMENVKGLPSGKTKKDFRNMLKALQEAGYVNDYKILNTKDYGIPQNRERVFVVSIRKDLYYNGKRFEWPQAFKLNKCLADVLEKEVDKKYYLSQKLIDFFIYNTQKQKERGNSFKFSPTDGNTYAKLLTCNTGSRMDDNFILDKVNQIGNISNSDSFDGNPQTGRIYGIDGIAPTLSTMQGGGQEPKIMIGASRGRDKNNPSDRSSGNNNLEQRLEINKQGIANTLTSVQKDNLVIHINSATKGGVRKTKPRRFC